MYIRVYVYVYVCMHVCAHVCTYIYIYIYTGPHGKNPKGVPARVRRPPLVSGNFGVRFGSVEHLHSTDY